MRKMFLAIALLLLSMSSCFADPAFEVRAIEIREVPYFRTLQTITLYDGGKKVVSYDQLPAEGMKFVLTEVTVAKRANGSESANLSRLELRVSGETYPRIEDNFLSNHNYQRLPGYEISFGSKSGYACFEVPVSCDIQGATVGIADPSAKDDERMVAQKRLEKQIMEFYEQGVYGLDNPCIVQDPYGLSPLTALVMFRTEKPTRVSVRVRGRDDVTNIVHDFVEVTREHRIPICGLYAGADNEVEVAAVAESGEKKEITLHIRTEDLPSDISKVRVDVKKTDKMAKGLTFFDCPHVNGNYPLAIDANGDIRWYLSDKSLNGSVMMAFMKNGNLIVSSGKVIPNTYNNLSSVYEISPLGKIVKEYRLYGIHHDVREKSDGNLIFCASMEGRRSQNDYIVEIDRGSGHVLRTWDLMEIIPMTEYDTQPPYSGGLSNWLHHNALWYLEGEDAFVISGRHQNLILKFDAKTKEIKWAFSATAGDLNEKLRPYLLRPESSHFEYPASQHAAMMLPDGKLFLFDNRNFMDKPMEGEPLNQSLLYSRAVLYEINERNGTIREVWQYGKERGKELYSSFGSDVDVLGPQHYLIDFGGMYKTEDGSNYDHMFTPAEVKNNSLRPSVIVELLKDEVIFEACLYGNANSNSYKAERKNIYENLSEATLLE